MAKIESKINNILETWKSHAAIAEANSKSGKIPRTYDKAIKLIKELEKELNGLPYIV